MSLTLRNAYLEVTIRPECGGRIDQITDLARGKAWLWHPAGYDPDVPRELSRPTSFDASWQGGFEEMFPNDAACTIDEYDLADHGEAWSSAWDTVASDAHTLTLAMTCTTMPFRLEKRLELDPDAPLLHLRYRITNQSDASLPCMLKLHPALAIEAGDEIEMPPCRVEPVALGFSAIAGQDTPTRWPQVLDAGGDAVTIDRALPATSGLREFVYCAGLSEGRCGVRNPRTGAHLQMHFDRSLFPFVWVFQSYGGYNGHYVLMLEPCTGKPYDLRDVIAEDTALWVHGGETRTLTLDLLAT